MRLQTVFNILRQVKRIALLSYRAVIPDDFVTSTILVDAFVAATALGNLVLSDADELGATCDVEDNVKMNK